VYESIPLDSIKSSVEVYEIGPGAIFLLDFLLDHLYYPNYLQFRTPSTLGDKLVFR